MSLSFLDWIFWASILLGHVTLLTILLVRHRWRGFPVFTVFVCSNVARDALLFAIYVCGSRVWYARVYYAAIFLDFALQLGVIAEIARIVMRPTGTWVRDARKQFFLWGAAGVLFAAALAWAVSPPASTAIGALEVRGNFFTSVLVCELIAAVRRTSKNLGLGWRNHVMALGDGWTAWAMVAILVNLLHSYFGTHIPYVALAHARMFAYLAALVYWCIQFWLEEPPRQPIPDEFRAYILALHERVKKDLDTLNAQR